MIAVEDPDLVYANLAECDTAQHIFGTADVPEEWDISGTPDVLWDDTNIFNPNANRDPILDVIYEADQSFGLILDMLEARGVLDGSYGVLLSDHGQTTVRSQGNALEVRDILSAAGVSSSSIERVVTAGELGWIALTETADGEAIESLLEGHQETHPVLGIPVSPFIVFNREEMDSGLDSVEGQLAADGIFGNKRGGLYSEWAIDFPVTDNSKVRWPDLFIFNRHHFQNSLLRADTLYDPSYRPLFHGHHASLLSKRVLTVIRGPGVAPGIYGGRVTLADIAPTLYALTGLVPPDNVDGDILTEILLP
jgi:arylsulfatase A-like enzyme